MGTLFLQISLLLSSTQQKRKISKLDTYFIMFLFHAPVLLKGLKKNIQNEIWAKYFSVTYMRIWPTAMNETIVKIRKLLLF